MSNQMKYFFWIMLWSIACVAWSYQWKLATLFFFMAAIFLVFLNSNGKAKETMSSEFTKKNLFFAVMVFLAVVFFALAIDRFGKSGTNGGMLIGSERFWIGGLLWISPFVLTKLALVFLTNKRQ